MNSSLMIDTIFDNVHTWAISFLRRLANIKGGHPLFFPSPLPLVRYLEIVLPLRAGPLFSKIC